MNKNSSLLLALIVSASLSPASAQVKCIGGGEGVKGILPGGCVPGKVDIGEAAKDAVSEAVANASYIAAIARATDAKLALSMIYFSYADELVAPKGSAIDHAPAHLTRKAEYWKGIAAGLDAASRAAHKRMKTVYDEYDALKKRAEATGTVGDLIAAAEAARSAVGIERESVAVAVMKGVVDYIQADIESDREFVGHLIKNGPDEKAAAKRLEEKANLLEAVGRKADSIRY